MANDPTALRFPFYITLKSDDRHDDLYKRLMDFFGDNLHMASRIISEHEEPLTVDEDLGRTFEDTIVVMWLKMIQPGLTQFVKQLPNNSLIIFI